MLLRILVPSWSRTHDYTRKQRVDCRRNVRCLSADSLKTALTGPAERSKALLSL